MKKQSQNKMISSFKIHMIISYVLAQSLSEQSGWAWLWAGLLSLSSADWLAVVVGRLHFEDVGNNAVDLNVPD